MEGMMDKKEMKNMMTKMHGRKESSVMMAHQGASAFMSDPSKFKNPFSSEAQRKYMWAKEPAIAEKWSKEGKNKGLPYRKRHLRTQR